MRLPRPTKKIFSLLLTLFLLMASAAPAVSICDGLCGCHGENNEITLENGLSTLRNHNETSKSHPLKHFMKGPDKNFMADIYPTDSDCHGPVEASCHMDTPWNPDLIQGSVALLDRSANFSFDVYHIIHWETETNSGHSLLSKTGSAVVSRAGPVPSYLMNQSFLC